jgi:hypothetical protein
MSEIEALLERARESLAAARNLQRKSRDTLLINQSIIYIALW